MGRKISIVSGKGGVGKSTIACGIALALAKSNFSVCLVDLDIGLNNLDVYLGLENKVVYDLGDCINGKCRLKQALVNLSGVENLYLLPSVRFATENYAATDIEPIVSKLSSVFDFVLIDAPAGMNAGFEMAIKASNETIVVVTPHVSSLRDADKVISRLKGAGINNVNVVVNRIRGDMVARGEMLSHEQVARLLKTPLLGVVPESDNINIYSSFRFERIAKNKEVVIFSILAHNLRSDKKIIYDYQSRYKGVLGMIRRAMKRSL